MNKVKKLSVIFLFFGLLISSFFGANFEFGKIKTLDAESNFVSISATKVNYSNDGVTFDASDALYPNKVKRLGEYSSEELLQNKNEILNSAVKNSDGEKITYSSGEVASICSTTKTGELSNEAILISVEAKSNAYLTSITPSLTLTNSLGTTQILVGAINKTNISSQFLFALDFSNLKNKMGEDVSYTEGLLNFNFRCSYTTDGTNVINETLDFSLYLIDEKIYFEDNGYKILNCNKQESDSGEVYMFNNTYDNGNQSTLSFDPTKFEPEIDFVYNETTVKLTTQYENDKVTLSSSNEKIIPSEIFNVNTDETTGKKTVQMSFRTLGQYSIKYYLIFNLNGTYTKLDLNICQKIDKLAGQSLIIFGYEAYYKNYSTDNLDYTYLYNDKYSSNFSYLVKSFVDGTKTVDENVELIKSGVLENLNKNTSLSNKIAKTNQAPVKINSYVTKNLTAAKYYTIKQTTSGYEFVDASGKAFLSSNRFEENGIYLVVIPYEFSIASTDNYYSILVFNIQNNTPSLEFYKDELRTETISANGFTSGNVFAFWDKDEELPFMAKTKIEIVKNQTKLSDYTINERDGKNYIEFSEDGEYVVKLTYGVYETVIEKKFTIDKQGFNIGENFKIVEILENSLKDISLSSNTTTIFGQKVIVTKNNFAIFAKNKNYSSNLISIKYDYITLNSVTAQKLLALDGNSLTVFNNYQFSSIYNNLTYSNIHTNNLSELSLSTDLLKNNSNAQVSISALYKFTILDKAGNSSEFYVLLDKTENVMLETSNVANLENIEQLVLDGKILEKQDYTNMAFDDYSIICGDYKGLEIKIDSSADAVGAFKKFFNDEADVINSGIYSVKIKNEKMNILRENLVSGTIKNVETSTENEILSSGNIFSVNPSEEEIDYIYTITCGLKKSKFELNTDKNLILICGEDNSGKFRVFNSSATNSEKVYIHFLDDAIDENDKLASLTLIYYPYDKETKNYLSGQSFDLLNSTDLGEIVLSGTTYSGYVTGVINATYSNGKYVTKEGKYEIVKSYKADPSKESKQTFYVDRLSPLELLSENEELFKFNSQALTTEILNNFLTNNLPIKTNMLNLTGFKDLAKMPNNDKIVLNYVLLDSTKQIINSFDGNFASLAEKGTKFYIRIYDNCGKRNSNAEYEIDSSNYVDIEINIDQTKPNGTFVVNNKQEILEKSSSTNSNTLSFVFEDSTSDYLYSIDYKNLVLYDSNKVEIFKTTSKSNNLTTDKFSFEDDEVFYYTKIGKVFNLTREELSSVTESGKKRYRYTLKILDPQKAKYSTDGYELFDENLTSLENKFYLIASYACGDYELIFDENNFKVEEYSMIIDHTSPKENFIQYLKNDKFLSGEYIEATNTFTGEKLQMYNSILNKDYSSEINFENYTFVLTSNSLSPQNFGETDTNNIYIRKYDKYNKTDDENLQSFVIGDNRFENLLIKRNRFDVNAKLNNTNVYTSKSYSNDAVSIDNFFTQKGYYEIIEIDQAGNYTIYSVLYVDSNDFKVEYTIDDEIKYLGTNGYDENTISESDHFGMKLNLSKINISSFTSLNVEVKINEGAKNEQISKFRYFPVEVEKGENEEYVYFNSIDTLVNNINSLINSYSSLNEFGNVYKIQLTNASGKTILITNSTPNKEISIESYVISDNEKLIFTIPYNENNATQIKSFNVYPVINGKIDKTSPLEVDSNSKELKLDNQVADVNFVFTSNISVRDTSSSSGYTNKVVNIYYFEWTDNFGRKQYVVKEINSQDKKEFNFNGNTNLTKDGEIYTANLENVDFVYQTNLYSIEVQCQLLPNTTLNTLYSNSETKGEAKVNFYSLLSEKYGQQNLESLKEKQIRFIVKLTDLKTLSIEDEVVVYEYSYIYYPTMPSVDFTDSSSNSLSIYPTNKIQSSISTSKNVNMLLTNTTIFNISVNAKRTYTDEFGQEIIEELSDIGTEYTFNKLGKYVVTVENELNNKQEFVFNITTSNNKTYLVRTNETDITNYELTSNNITQTLKFDGGEALFEIYYSIYDTTIEVNSDFNLSAQTLTPLAEYASYNMWVINKTESGKTVPYKYIAVEKIDYTRNFLKFAEEETLLTIQTSSSEDNLASTLTRPSITTTSGVLVSVPLANKDQNKIVIKVFYNNNLIELNSNFYSIANEIQTLNLTSTPAGTYDLYFEDLAGNLQFFEGNAYLRIIILSEVAIKINNEIPVNYQIYNSTVNLSILETKQYITNSSTYSINVTALKNNQEYKVKTNENGEYVFSDYGFYKVTITAYVNEKDKNLGSITKVTKEIYFTILNPNEALKEYSFVSLNGQNISKILKDNVDVTNEIKRFIQVGALETNEFDSSYLYDLTLSPELKYARYELNEDGTEKVDENGDKIISDYDIYYASGHYEIFVDTQNLILGTQTYSFKVWIRDKDAFVNLNTSLENGGTTSKEITISFNPFLMYSQIGESAIYVNNEKKIEINANSSNSILTVTIPKSAKGTYIIQLKQANGNTELSYIFNKKEPLSTVSIVVITISCLAVAFVIVLFIKLRTRIKIK